MAAAEWADSIGVDVVSSSLAYLDFDGTANDYQYTDLDGYTTVVALGAIMAARHGIVVCNAMGNEGGRPGRSGPPRMPRASFGRRRQRSELHRRILGPRSDRGRAIKPEVVAQGINVQWAVAGQPTTYLPAKRHLAVHPARRRRGRARARGAPRMDRGPGARRTHAERGQGGDPDNDFGHGRIDVVKAIYGSSYGVPAAPKPFILLVPIDVGAVVRAP